MDFEVLEDEPANAGPIGALRPFFRRAHENKAWAVLVGCDMPFLSAELFRALLEAPASDALAPRRNGLWEPLFSRFDAQRCLPAVDDAVLARELSLQRLLDRVGAQVLPLSREQEAQLRDWDAESDML
jgi:molybdopterin-guanine dinucleotide biosynthesis protein A